MTKSKKLMIKMTCLAAAFNVYAVASMAWVDKLNHHWQGIWALSWAAIAPITAVLLVGWWVQWKYLK